MTKRVDNLPLADLIEWFRRDCLTAKILHGSMETEDKSIDGDMLQQHINKNLRFAPKINLNSCHAFDFGYIFGGGDDPKIMTQQEADMLIKRLFKFGIFMSHDDMLFVTRVAFPQQNYLLLTHIYQDTSGIVMKFYCLFDNFEQWLFSGHVENVKLDNDYYYTLSVKSWGIFVGTEDSESAIARCVNQALVLMAMLMRRGDEVTEERVVKRDAKRGGPHRNQPAASMSIIRLNKHKLIKNVEDEADAVPVPVDEADAEAHQKRPHDRGGTICERITDPTCRHGWIEEYRDENRWRERCWRCWSTRFWRREAKIHGGAEAVTLHRVVR